MVICLALSIILYTLLAGWRPSNVFPPLASLPLILALFALIVRIHVVRFTRQWISWYMLLITMFVWCFFADFMNGRWQGNLDRYEAFLFATAFALVCATVVRSEAKMRFLLFAAVCSTALSSVVAVLQISPYREPFLALWQWRYMANAPEEAIPRLRELYTFILNGRAAGMTPYSLTLAHQIVATGAIAVCLLATERRRSYRALFTVCLGALIFGAFATGARIAIWGSLTSIILTALQIRRPAYAVVRRHYLQALALFGVFVLAVLTLVILPSPFSFYKLRILTTGEAMRLKTWGSIGMLLSERPQVLLVGLGGGGFNEWGKGVGVLGSTHNQFLGTFVEYGLVGFLLLCWFYLQTFRLIIKRFNINQPLQKELQWKCMVYRFSYIISLSAYLIASLFHDQGAVTGDLFHVMVLSVFVTLSVVINPSILTQVATLSHQDKINLREQSQILPSEVSRND